jgi:hypothetical protein
LTKTKRKILRRGKWHFERFALVHPSSIIHNVYYAHIKIAVTSTILTVNILRNN